MDADVPFEVSEKFWDSDDEVRGEGSLTRSSTVPEMSPRRNAKHDTLMGSCAAGSCLI
jgi:hypothetical protein